MNKVEKMDIKGELKKANGKNRFNDKNDGKSIKTSEKERNKN